MGGGGGWSFLTPEYSYGAEVVTEGSGESHINKF